MVYVRPLYVCFDLEFILFRIAWWPSAETERCRWLSARVVFISCRLSCMCSFPVRWMGQDMEFVCISS